jgi:hypothetical protein
MHLMIPEESSRSSQKPLMNTILSQLNPIHIANLNLLKINFNIVTCMGVRVTKITGSGSDDFGYTFS